MTEGGHSSRDGGVSRLKSAGHELDAQRYRILKDLPVAKRIHSLRRAIARGE